MSALALPTTALISTLYLFLWEAGKNQPDVEMLTQIAEQFGVSVEYLIYGKESKPDNGEKKFVWDKGRFHFAITYYPEKAAMLGAVLAMIISYVNWRSIGWAIVHGVLNWVYVIYYVIRY